MPAQEIDVDDGRLAARVPRDAAGRDVERPDLAADRVRRGLDDDRGQGRHPAHAAAGSRARGEAAASYGEGAGDRLARRTRATRSSSGRSTRRGPADAAMVVACTTLLRGAGYAAFDGQLPRPAEHAALASPYAHVTAPLRRLVDRYGLEICAALCAGEPVPAWVLDGDGRPARRHARLRAQGQRLRERGAQPGRGRDAQGRVGERFDGVVLEADNDAPHKAGCRSRSPRWRPGWSARTRCRSAPRSRSCWPSRIPRGERSSSGADEVEW